MTAFSFNLEKKSSLSRARLGEIHTKHGTIRTPAFMPVGTAATVKGMHPEQVAQTGADVILGNTYHLMLRPSSDVIEQIGGLHKFMNWHKPILTDSGGFQVMSLSKLRKINENGVEFQSHIDGEKIMLTPESSIKIQNQLGSTVTMAFDECTPFPATRDEAANSMELSMRWARRSFDSFHEREGYGIFGIMQGSTFEDLRAISAEKLKEIPFHGYAIGGLAVGEGQELMFSVLDYAPELLPQEKPRYLMGVGTPDDIIGAVKRGVDMFDCVIPTRSARFGRAYTSEGELNIKNSQYRTDSKPLDEKCPCPVCQNYSRAYINHLFKAEEMLGAMLMTMHNLHFYQNLMSDIRKKIKNGEF